jgi:O-methyltransferase involved in polyketide biosynthesis
VPLDFERQALARELAAAGFVARAGALFAWLGVVPYLERVAIRATLEAVAELSRAGGGVVFDYAVPASSLNLIQRAAFELMAARVKAAGEPWRSFFEPEELARELSALGFTDVQDLGGEQLNERYFAGREDGLRVGSMARVLTALHRTTRRGA